jgi:predicted nucleotidyltransferase
MDSNTTSRHSRHGTRRPGDQLARVLRAHSSVQAVCVFGSAARGSEDDLSDLDLLVVTRGELKRSELPDQVREMGTKGDAEIRVLSEQRLREMFARQTVFATHLAREGRVLMDDSGAITALFDGYPRDEPVKEDGGSLRARLKAYDDLAWCGGRYLLCLADLHAWGRSGAMLALARQGEFQFDRDQLFPALARRFPDLGESAEVVERLRPFWLAVRRRIHVDFPFSPNDSHEETRAARDACRQILDSIP